MERDEFAKVMQEVLDSLPGEFRSRIRNVAVLVEDFPPHQKSGETLGRVRGPASTAGTTDHSILLIVSLVRGFPVRHLMATLKTFWCTRDRVHEQSTLQRAYENTYPPPSNVARCPRFSCTPCR